MQQRRVSGLRSRRFLSKMTSSVKQLCAFLVLLGLALLGGGQNRNAVASGRTWCFQQWRLVWADEFNYNGLPDPKKWGYDVGGHGWGNQELQYYTERRKENARVENGLLIIEARRDSWQGHEYTSARLVTKGKGDWTYGRIEVKAKLPSGRGTWPAIWMLPTGYEYGGWPSSGEIDIMEHVGFDPDIVHASVHTKAYNHKINTQKTAKIKVDNARSEFNVYAVEWTPEEIRGYVNETPYFTFRNERLTNPATLPSGHSTNRFTCSSISPPAARGAARRELMKRSGRSEWKSIT
jgi:beta-glucanase (GH16 family)